MPDFALVSDFAPTGDQLEVVLHSAEGDQAVKLERLGHLRAQIIDEMCVRDWRDVWFFPEHKGVLGWKGTQDIMFVGLNPSMGSFPTKADEFLYKQLRLNEFENAHLTDAVKIRATAGESGRTLENAALMNQQKLYFLKELNIVQPCLIVAMGQRAEGILRNWLPNRNDIRRIQHYAYRFSDGKQFSRQMREARTVYEGLKRYAHA